jgi:glycosyltransferase involved in cell wall biosynthesis
LPFEWKELLRYGFSLFTLRLILLRFLQIESIKKANGIIFLSHYSKKIVCRITDNELAKSTIVPHGVNPNFFNEKRIARGSSEFSFNNPCKIVYTSSIDPYKHQVNVILAVAKIRSSGLFINLDLIGPSNISSKKKLITIIGQVDPLGEYIRYLGNVNYNELSKLYLSYDMAVFASSCETFGMIVLEKMASGLPMLCSDKSSMSEILGNSGIYFDPLNILDIEHKIKILILSKVKRNNFSRKAYLNAKTYSWKRSSMDTFSFLRAVYKGRSR